MVYRRLKLCNQFWSGCTERIRLQTMKLKHSIGSLSQTLFTVMWASARPWPCCIWSTIQSRWWKWTAAGKCSKLSLTNRAVKKKTLCIFLLKPSTHYRATVILHMTRYKTICIVSCFKWNKITKGEPCWQVISTERQYVWLKEQSQCNWATVDETTGGSVYVIAWPETIHFN